MVLLIRSDSIEYTKRIGLSMFKEKVKEVKEKHINRDCMEIQ